MKISIFFTTIFISILLGNLKGQTCSYTSTNNYSIQQDTGLVFKTIIYFNVKTLKYDTLDLKMDIIKPSGDNNTKRPIVMYFHGFNESYKYSNLHVKRVADVMVKERGFILASVEYKIWALPYTEASPSNCGNLLLLLNGVYSPYDTSESIRANYRLAQDANDAIKFVKNRSVLDSSCKNLCFVSGFSAGGIVAMSTTFISPSEKPLAANTISPANYTNLFGSAISPTVSIARSDLGSVYGNLYTSQNTNIKGAVIFNSGIQDINFIKNNDPALFIYHSTNDPNVSPDSSTVTCFTDHKNFGQNLVKNRALSQGYVLNSNLIISNSATNHDFYDTQIREGANFINSQINVANCICDSSIIQSIDKISISDELFIYGYDENIYINSKNEYNNVDVTITDLYGKTVFENQINIHKKTVIQKQLNAGLYIVKLNFNNKYYVQKVFIR